MIDLNSKQFDSVSKIFNDGNAGKVDNVTVAVELKQAGTPETYPDFKLIVTDETGNSINAGFYYPKANPQKDDATNKAAMQREVSRIVHIAKAVVGPDYDFPAVKTAKEAFDALFKIIGSEAGDKKFSVFVSYGTKSYPSKYLGLRYFNFIEPAGAEPTRLKASAMDMLERVDPDNLSGGSASTSSAQSAEDEEWL
jgi:hypothetical protein